MNLGNKGHKNGVQRASNLASGEVQKILSTPPRPVLLWGNAGLFLLVIALLCVAIFVKYPLELKSEVILYKRAATHDAVAGWDVLTTVSSKTAQKITRGQHVVIELNDYPAARYGSLGASIVEKTQSPASGRVLLKLRLDNSTDVIAKTEEAVLKGYTRIAVGRQSWLQRFVQKTN